MHTLPAALQSISRAPSPHRLRRLVAAALTTVAVTLGAMAALSAPASADPSVDACWHGSGPTVIQETLPASSAANIVDDVYLYHWSGRAWVLVSSTRMRGTSGRVWLDASGHMWSFVGFNLRVNSGYYYLKSHVWSPALGMQGYWQNSIGYSDNLYGTTSYCYA